MISSRLRQLFGDPLNAMLSLGVLAVALVCLPPLIRWGLVNAVFQPDPAACEAAQGQGACWGVVTEKAASSCSAATRPRRFGARCWPPG